MAHKFQSGVMFGQPAWHGLGTTLPEDSAIRTDPVETMKAAGLDWEVGCESIYTPDMKEIAGWQSVTRKDTKEVLGIVGDRYKPLQNHEQFDFFKPFLESGECQFETAGSLAGGTIVWVLARLNLDDATVTTGDVIRKYILLASSHDGTLATSAGFTPVRVVCWNTLSAALMGDTRKMLRIKHTARQQEALKLVQETMKLAEQGFEATAQQYRKMLNCRINRQDLRNYVAKVLEAPADQSEWSTRLKNQIADVCLLASKGKGNAEVAGTVWAAYNAVTEYLSYDYGRTPDSRLKSLWFGQNKTVNNSAFELALQLAS